MVLRAAGPVFSSGHNLKELTTEHGIEHHVRVFDACNDLMEDIFGSGDMYVRFGEMMQIV